MRKSYGPVALVLSISAFPPIAVCQTDLPPSAASASSSPTNTATVQPPNVAVDAVNLVKLSTPAAARTAPPFGPLNAIVGEKVADLKKDTVWKVVSRKSYGSFSGSEVWFEVVPPSNQASLPTKPVWIFGGTLQKFDLLPDRVTAVKLASYKTEQP